MGYNKKKHLVNNIQAIGIAFELERHNQEPTAGQRELLEQYSGFGGLPCILKPCEKAEDRDRWLPSEKELFDDTVRLYGMLREYSATESVYKRYADCLKESRLTAFYTPSPVIRAMAGSFRDWISKLFGDKKLSGRIKIIIPI